MVGKKVFEVDPSYLRKIRKPLVEKKRRDRMNVGIEQLRMLLAAADSSMSMVKLDKAEVLEHAVQHLERLQQRKHNPSPATPASYTSGFRDCTRETMQFLERTGMIPQPAILQLSRHLGHVCPSTPSTSTRYIAPRPAPEVRPRQSCSSTPLSTSSTDRLPVPISDFQRDSISPVLDFQQCLNVDLSQQFMDASLMTSFERSHSPADSGISVSDSVISSVSLSTLDDASSTMDVKSSVSNTGTDTGSDIIKEAAPWRPW